VVDASGWVKPSTGNVEKESYVPIANGMENDFWRSFMDLEKFEEFLTELTYRKVPKEIKKQLEEICFDTTILAELGTRVIPIREAQLCFLETLLNEKNIAIKPCIERAHEELEKLSMEVKKYLKWKQGIVEAIRRLKDEVSS